MPASTHENISRRDLLTLAWKSLLALSGTFAVGGLVRFFSYQPNPPPQTLFDLGPVEGVTADSVITIPQAQAALIPVEQGWMAVSLVCPHLGCEVEAKKDGFLCPCHNSQFNLDGSLKKGPAAQPLTPLRLEVTEEGHLLLDTSGS